MAVDKKISQLASGAPAQAGDEYVVARSGANYKLTLTNIAASMPATTITSGNLTFSSTAQRITGDFSNATLINRLSFQTSTTNGNTVVNVLPNGTSQISRLIVNNNSDPTNASYGAIDARATEVQIYSAINGTGTYLPMTFIVGGSERVRIDTSGNVGIGVTPTVNLDVKNAGGNCTISAQYGTGTKGQLIAASNEVQLKAFNGTNDVLTFATGTTERMRIDSSGNVGIGGTASAFAKVQKAGTLPTSSNISVGDYITGTIPSGSTSAYYGYYSAPTTQATSFTCGAVIHYYTNPQAFGAGSTVTNQYGYYAESTLTGATNNYGFFSNIASGSNRWNFYAAGTAANYFAGNVAINSTGAPNSKIVIGNSSYTHINDGNSNTVPFLASINNDTVSSATFGWLWYNNATNGNLDFYRRAGSTTDVHVLTFARATGEAYFSGNTDNGAYNVQCNGTGVWGAGAYVNGSDARIKEDINPIASAIDIIEKLNPVTYRYKEDWSKDRSVQTGFIAQELLAALDGQVYVDGIVQQGGSQGYYSVAYQNIIPILTKAIQELTARVAELEAK